MQIPFETIYLQKGPMIWAEFRVENDEKAIWKWHICMYEFVSENKIENTYHQRFKLKKFADREWLKLKERELPEGEVA